jgi:hypothetical protein
MVSINAQPVKNVASAKGQACLAPPTQVISIGAACIVEIDGQFFLLVEIEIKANDVGIEQIIVFSLTAAEAQALINAGVPVCETACEIPQPCPGEEIKFRCVLVIDNHAFLVFEIENRTERLVLVRAELCPVIGLDAVC